MRHPQLGHVIRRHPLFIATEMRVQVDKARHHVIPLQFKDLVTRLNFRAIVFVNGYAWITHIVD